MSKGRKTIHVVSNSHWDREWGYPFEETRLLLLDFMDNLLELLDRDKDFHSFTMDSQTLCVEDYLELRPEKRATVEKHVFQAEVNEVLSLVVNSLYSHREVFLRELISNAADAIDQLNFRSLTDHSLLGDDKELRIELVRDAKANTLTIRDNGIGMTRDELIGHLGTIARSGSKKRRVPVSNSGKDIRSRRIATAINTSSRRPTCVRASASPSRLGASKPLHAGSPGPPQAMMTNSDANSQRAPQASRAQRRCALLPDSSKVSRPAHSRRLPSRHWISTSATSQISRPLAGCTAASVLSAYAQE